MTRHFYLGTYEWSPSGTSPRFRSKMTKTLKCTKGEWKLPHWRLAFIGLQPCLVLQTTSQQAEDAIQ